MDIPRPAGQARPTKLRLACDRCHDAKMRCTGGKMCKTCGDVGEECVYSVQQKAGRPKGAKNRKTRGADRSNPSTSISTSMSTSTSRSASVTDIDAADLAAPVGHAGPTPHSNEVTGPYDQLLSDTPCASTQDLLHGDGADLWDAFQQQTHAIHFDQSQDYFRKDHSAADAMYPSRPRSSQSPSGMHGLRASYGHILAAAPAPAAAPISRIDSIGSLGSIAIPALSSAWSSPSGRSSLSSVPQTPLVALNCNCLQQHADLLCLLKSIERRHTPSPIDVALSSTKQALGPWQGLVGCGMAQDATNGALLLAVLSMRIVVQRLELIATDSDTTAQSNLAFPHGPTPYWVERVSIGNYEASGHEQRLVADLLILRALDQIKAVIVALNDKIDAAASSSAQSSPQHRPQCTPVHPHSHSHSLHDATLVPQSSSETDVEYVKGLLSNLAGTVNSIDRALRTRSAASLQ